MICYALGGEGGRGDKSGGAILSCLAVVFQNVEPRILTMPRRSTSGGHRPLLTNRFGPRGRRGGGGRWGWLIKQNDLLSVFWAKYINRNYTLTPLACLNSRMQLNVHAIRRAPHSASCLVQAMPAWSLKTRRAPSRHCRDARVYGHTTTAMNEMSTPPLGSSARQHLRYAILQSSFRVYTKTCSILA